MQRAVLHRVLGLLALDRVGEDVGDRDHEVDVGLAEGVGPEREHAEAPHGATEPFDPHAEAARTSCSEHHTVGGKRVSNLPVRYQQPLPVASMWPVGESGSIGS